MHPLVEFAFYASYPSTSPRPLSHSPVRTCVPPPDCNDFPSPSCFAVALPTGTSPECQSKLGLTPLVAAAEGGQLSVVRLLLEVLSPLRATHPPPRPPKRTGTPPAACLLCMCSKGRPLPPICLPPPPVHHRCFRGRGCSQLEFRGSSFCPSLPRNSPLELFYDHKSSTVPTRELGGCYIYYLSVVPAAFQPRCIFAKTPGPPIPPFLNL